MAYIHVDSLGATPDGVWSQISTIALFCEAAVDKKTLS